MKLRSLIACLCFLLLGGVLAHADGLRPAAVNFGALDSVFELKHFLAPYHAPGGAEPDGSVWYMLEVTNESVRPAIRVLVAGQPPRMALSVRPHGARPTILAVASSDSGVEVEPANAYGHRAWRVIIPPVTSVGLALRVGNAQTPPSLMAWTEPALASHNRQLAIFVTAVGALIAAAALITGGLAILIGHRAPRWAAITLVMLLLSWLAGSGTFDASLGTHIGGPYGLSAFLTALTLAAGARLADAIIPVRDSFPRHARLFERVLYGLCGLGALAYLGVPGATLLTDSAIVAGSTAIAAYLVFCGRIGVKAAQVIAPSAAAFAMVAVAAAVTTLGGLGDSLTAPATTGGFAAAGAILLALAVIASEEIAVLPFLHGSGAAKLLEAQDANGAVDHNAPFANLALAAIGSAHQGVFDLDFRAQLLTLSAEAAVMMGLPAHEATLSHAEWIARLQPADRDPYRRTVEAHRARPGTPFRVEFRVATAAKTVRWLELRATIVTDQDVPSDCLGLLADISDMKQAGLPPLRDPLTGLGTRAAMNAALDSLGPALKESSLAIIDMDRFKTIHASLGDLGGDRVLLETAQRLEGRFAREAQIFRMGGDAFALLFAPGRRALQRLGDEIVALCQPPHPFETRSIFAPASVGLAAHCIDPPTLIRWAEQALRAAKSRGGSCAQVWEPSLESDSPGDAVELEADLRRALDEGQLDVFYQPIMRLADRTVAGFEALLRWHHPDKGLVSPGGFIAHSEETGLIVALGQFALERAANDLAQWQRYFPLEPALFVSVNLSRRQLRDHAFETLLARVLKTGQIVKGTLRLEVTESAIGADGELSAILLRIRDAGAGLSIDDFGTGSSTLSQFRTLPFDTVKIDKSFLSRKPGAEMGADAETVLQSIVTLAHDLNRAVVIEGVESASDAEWLNGLGCEYGQGYYFAPPLTPADTLAFIARHFDLAAATPG